jgi:hypothetical protein
LRLEAQQTIQTTPTKSAIEPITIPTIRAVAPSIELGIAVAIGIAISIAFRVAIGVLRAWNQGRWKKVHEMFTLKSDSRMLYGRDS